MAIAGIVLMDGLKSDLHEFRLTDRGTALITAYERVPADVSAVGGPKDGGIVDSIVQEVDVATGRVRFQWRSSEHVPITRVARPAADREAALRSRLLPRQLGLARP